MFRRRMIRVTGDMLTSFVLAGTGTVHQRAEPVVVPKRHANPGCGKALRRHGKRDQT